MSSFPFVYSIISTLNLFAYTIPMKDVKTYQFLKNYMLPHFFTVHSFKKKSVFLFLTQYFLHFCLPIN